MHAVILKMHCYTCFLVPKFTLGYVINLNEQFLDENIEIFYAKGFFSRGGIEVRDQYVTSL